MEDLELVDLNDTQQSLNPKFFPATWEILNQLPSAQSFLFQRGISASEQPTREERQIFHSNETSSQAKSKVFPSSSSLISRHFQLKGLNIRYQCSLICEAEGRGYPCFLGVRAVCQNKVLHPFLPIPPTEIWLRPQILSRQRKSQH